MLQKRPNYILVLLLNFNNNHIKIGKDCPDEHDEDNCNLQEDNRALYEGPGAELFPARTWRDCYEECM